MFRYAIIPKWLGGIVLKLNKDFLKPNERLQITVQKDINWAKNKNTNIGLKGIFLQRKNKFIGATIRISQEQWESNPYGD